jgi:hypothetical protein
MSMSELEARGPEEHERRRYDFFSKLALISS